MRSKAELQEIAEGLVLNERRIDDAISLCAEVSRTGVELTIAEGSICFDIYEDLLP